MKQIGPHKHHFVYMQTGEDIYGYVHMSEKVCECQDVSREFCICRECVMEYVEWKRKEIRDRRQSSHASRP